ncbi:FUN14 domain-containing protein [Methylobacter svalbardensis]|uniref:FUN14 domain-containing protein n=1 Tax=Methylobacter svalbardensis TaxID=3080016 RepID=UPI0030EDC61E
MNIHPVEAASSSSDIFSSTFLIGSVGAPFVIGLAVGYFAKKMLRTALFLGGATIVLLFIAEHYDVIDITDEKLQHAASAATEAAKSSGGFLVDRLTSITSKGASGVGGFFVGFKLG